MLAPMGELVFEVCTDSVLGVLAARDGGAQRVELCAGLVEGGTTPSAGLLAAACEVEGIDVVALIRPRAGDFVYSAAELDVMRRDVEFAASVGAAGVALGVLCPDGSIDEVRTADLVRAARPMKVTFHRAFDVVADRAEALEALVRAGIDRVLTSGSAATGVEGAAALERTIRLAGERIAVIAAGGVRSHNARELVELTGARELHFTARRPASSPMTHRVDLRLGAAEVPGEYDLRVTDAEIVRELIASTAG